MPDFIKDFFSWSKKERIGVIVLSVLLLSLFSLNLFFDRWITPEQKKWTADSLAYYIKILDSLEKELNPEPLTSLQKFKDNKPDKKSKAIYYPFDPNKIGIKEWMDFGFSAKQAQSILNYKKSIKGFKTSDDLGRCYVVDSAKMKRLRPFIKIDTTIFQLKNSDSSEKDHIKKIEKFVIVELNQADSIQLLSISGIGPYFSNKIINYREKLGGYYRKEQLLEIWNFDSARYQKISDHIIIDLNLIEKININQAETEELKSHPYIRWSLANAIVKYRIQHGNYNSVEEVKNVVLMTDSIFKKITPYIVAE